MDAIEIQHHPKYASATNPDLRPAKPTLEELVAEQTAELRHTLHLVEEQKRALEETLRQREARQQDLQAELTDTKLLHSISVALINEGVVGEFYQKLVDAAALIMRSDFASMQQFDAERGALKLIAHAGFNAEAQAYFEWVPPLRPTSCGMALHRNVRFMVSDFEQWDFAIGSEELDAFRAGGICAAQSTPLLSRDGKLVGMISTHWKHCHTPSERDFRMLDIIARQAADLIERNSAADALKAQAEQLAENDRRKDVFLATLAHELRNPLAPIQSGVAVLKLGNADEAPRVLKIMDRQVSHMVRLIDELLDLSRITSGIVTLKREHVTLRNLVDRAVETCRPSLDAAGHAFDVVLPAETMWLYVDVTRVAQVLGNLLNNAVRYTPAGGRIALIAQPDDGEVSVSISDNGIGIPAEMLGKVFDLFTRVDEAVERAQSGLGVGLSLARHLAELHGGKITASSRGAGQGATFTVSIPASGPPPEILNHNADERDAPCGAKRVLIVDDNVDAAESFAMLLVALGHHTHIVYESQKALDEAARFMPDVAFLDLGMPTLNGFDLARQLRRHPALANLELVALSGWGTENDRARGREAGVDHHLTKPVLLEAVQKILSSYGPCRAH